MLTSGTQVCGFKPFGREVPCRIFAARKRTLFDYVEVGSQAKLVDHFSFEVPSFTNRGLRDRAARGAIEDSTLEQLGRPWNWRRQPKGAMYSTKGQSKKGLGAYGVTGRLPISLFSVSCVSDLVHCEVLRKGTRKEVAGLAIETVGLLWRISRIFVKFWMGFSEKCCGTKTGFVKIGAVTVIFY
jgi:hypothetical protein